MSTILQFSLGPTQARQPGSFAVIIPFTLNEIDPLLEAIFVDESLPEIRERSHRVALGVSPDTVYRDIRWLHSAFVVALYFIEYYRDGDLELFWQVMDRLEETKCSAGA